MAYVCAIGLWHGPPMSHTYAIGLKGLTLKGQVLAGESVITLLRTFT